jgi:hypothetical protein
MILVQLAQLNFMLGDSECTGSIYEESAQIVKEKVSNIRTTLSLGYERKLEEISRAIPITPLLSVSPDQQH